MANIVQLRGSFARYEFLAGGTIVPGMLVSLTSAGTVIAHGTAGGHAQKWFAVEDSLQGNGTDTSYTSGLLVQVNAQVSGNKVQSWLRNGENVVKGDALMSDGAGRLRKLIGDSSSMLLENHIVAYAAEAVNMSGSSSADPDGTIEVYIA